MHNSIYEVSRTPVPASQWARAGGSVKYFSQNGLQGLA